MGTGDWRHRLGWKQPGGYVDEHAHRFPDLPLRPIDGRARFRLRILAGLTI